MDKLFYKHFNLVWEEGSDILRTLNSQPPETIALEVFIALALTAVILVAYLYFTAPTFDIDAIYKEKMESRSRSAAHPVNSIESVANRQREAEATKKNEMIKKKQHPKSQQAQEVETAMMRSQFLEKDLEFLNKQDREVVEIAVKVRVSCSNSSSIMNDKIEEVKVMSNATLQELKDKILNVCFASKNGESVQYVWATMKQNYTPELKGKVMLKLFKGTLGGFDFGNDAINEAPLHEMEVTNGTELYLVAYGKED